MEAETKAVAEVAGAAAMAALAGDCCTEETAKTGSTQKAVEAAALQELAAAEAGTKGPVEEEAADKSTAGEVMVEEGVGLWEARNAGNC